MKSTAIIRRPIPMVWGDLDGKVAIVAAGTDSYGELMLDLYRCREGSDQPDLSRRFCCSITLSGLRRAKRGPQPALLRPSIEMLFCEDRLKFRAWFNFIFGDESARRRPRPAIQQPAPVPPAGVTLLDRDEVRRLNELRPANPAEWHDLMAGNGQGLWLSLNYSVCHWAAIDNPEYSKLSDAEIAKPYRVSSPIGQVRIAGARLNQPPTPDTKPATVERRGKFSREKKAHTLFGE